MLFKRKERDEALKFLKSYQEPIGALIFHILLTFKVKSLFEEPIGVALSSISTAAHKWGSVFQLVVVLNKNHLTCHVSHSDDS